MKLLRKTKYAFLTLVFVMGASGVFAQHSFKYQAALQKVDTDGFYRISLAPALIAKSKADLSDLRILDQGKHFVPYLFGEQLVFKDQSGFIAFPQLKTADGADTVTTFVADNSVRLTINQLYLKLRNTSVERTVNLSGSDDLNHWYAIKENMALAAADGDNQSQGTYQQMLNFPSSTYRYFKIQILNKSKEPVAILQVGVYRQQSVKPGYVKITDGMVKQKDTANISSVTLRLNDNYQVNKLHLSVTGQKYYKRTVSIYEVGRNFKRLIADTMISSAGVQDLYFSVKAKTIELEISNGDNPPLAISGISAYQLDQSMISYLEKGKQYYMLSGDEKAVAPDYDLKFFGDSVQHQLAQISHGQVEKNMLYQQPVLKSNIKDDKLNNWLVGFAVGLVVIVLVLLTFKMTKEVNKRAEEKKNG